MFVAESSKRVPQKSAQIKLLLSSTQTVFVAECSTSMPQKVPKSSRKLCKPLVSGMALLTLVINGMGLHSSTFWLDVSTFCGNTLTHDFPPVY
jgi:hypothetical protein